MNTVAEFPRVGVAGARGIGKHHAKWFARAGCRVTAIYGTGEASTAIAAAALRDLFGFDGRTFHRWDEFLREGGFDACAVCSPPEAHLENVASLAAAGKHVLCEKPLAWCWTHDAARQLADAEALVAVAERNGILLAVNAQYPALLDGWRELHRAVLHREPAHRSLRFVMETRGAPRSPHGPAEAWVDLGPHPLAVLDALAAGQVDWTTLRHTDGPQEAILDFDWIAPEARLAVHIETRRVPGPQVRRWIGNQDFLAEYEGCTVDGDFAARLLSAGHEWTGPDPMRVSVERFVEAVRAGNAARLLVSGHAALRQHRALVGIWERCWGGATSGTVEKGRGKERTG